MTNYMSHTEIIEATQPVAVVEEGLPETLTVKRIEFGFSESAYMPQNIVCNSLAEAEALLKTAALHAPDNGAYDKTDFQVFFNEVSEEDTSYSGRFDMQRQHAGQAHPLKNWMVSFVEYQASRGQYGEETEQIVKLYRNLQ